MTSESQEQVGSYCVAAVSELMADLGFDRAFVCICASTNISQVKVAVKTYCLSVLAKPQVQHMALSKVPDSEHILNTEHGEKVVADFYPKVGFSMTGVIVLF
jgi:hypothetical protein